LGFPEYEKLAGLGRSSVKGTAANLDVIEESAAEGEVSELYEHFRARFGRPEVPGILKCFATHPPLLRHMMDLSEHMLFAEGSLGRRHKEMIATLVSTQNHCGYCADSHGFFFRVHGGTATELEAIQANCLASPDLTAAERALLEFARKVNIESHGIARSDVHALLQAGWSQLQIAETVHLTALFATFNRVVNAFGLESQGLLALYVNEPAASHAKGTGTQA
jgi:uncharacterized peroxidase-related enzyme